MYNTVSIKSSARQHKCQYLVTQIRILLIRIRKFSYADPDPAVNESNNIGTLSVLFGVILSYCIVIIKPSLI